MPCPAERERKTGISESHRAARGSWGCRQGAGRKWTGLPKEGQKGVLGRLFISHLFQGPGLFQPSGWSHLHPAVSNKITKMSLGQAYFCKINSGGSLQLDCSEDTWGCNGVFASKSRPAGLGTPRLTLNLNSLNLLSLLWTFKMHLKKKKVTIEKTMFLHFCWQD